MTRPLRIAPAPVPDIIVDMTGHRPRLSHEARALAVGLSFGAVFGFCAGVLAALAAGLS